MATESDVLSEIEVLQSIYLDELRVSRKDDGGWEVSLVLHPSTGEDCMSQFVRLTLKMDLDSEYPASPPRISVQNPRGLSDDKLLSLQQSLQLEVEACLGTPVLYQLIEKAKDILTESNIPHGNCVICLYGFKEGEVFTKTSCYHYFHSHCLGRYITHSEQELRERERELEEDKTREGAEGEELCVVCPVCREPLMYDVDTLLSSPAPVFAQQEDGGVAAEFKKKWATLQKILERQKEKGGIIDPEAESNRFLIHINDTPTDTPDSLCSDALNPEPGQPLPPDPPVCTGQTSVPQTHPTSHQTMQRPPQGRRHHGEYRGGRRGRGKRGGRNGPVSPVEDNFSKLAVSSEESAHIKTSLLPQNDSALAESTAQGHLDVLKADQHQISQCEELMGEDCVNTSHEDSSVPTDEQHVSQLKVNVSEDGTPTAVTDGERGRGRRDGGRRRGPRGAYHGQWYERNPRGYNQWDSAGVVHHRGGRGHRARGGGGGGGGGFVNHHRGGGTYRGAGKGAYPKAESEIRKEEV